MAGADQQLGVGAHERLGHGHPLAVGQDEPAAALPEVLDDREDVVPASGVEARGVAAQLVEDLLHLEGRGDRLDEDGGPDGALRDAQEVLGEDEHVVPQPRFEVRFELGQVEVGAAAEFDEALGVVEEVEPEVDQAAADRDAVDAQVALGQVPAPGADDDRGQVGQAPAGQAVGLALRGGEVDAPLDRVDEVDLRADHVVPAGRGGVLHVGQPAFRARVQRVDGHLALARAGDLDAPVLQAGRERRDRPGEVLADRGGLGQEARVEPVGDLRAALLAALEELLAAADEGAVEFGEEVQRLGRQDLVLPFRGRSGDGHRLGGAGAGEGVHVVLLAGACRWSVQNCPASVEPASAKVEPLGLSAPVTWSK